MRKIVVLFAALAALFLVSTSVGAQEVVFSHTVTYAEQQSMDLGDPVVYTVLIVEDLTDLNAHRLMIVADAGQMVNVEHPNGALGTIVGLLAYANEEVTLEAVLIAAETLMAQRGNGTMLYAGDEVLPENTEWVYAVDEFWTIETRRYVKDIIDVPNGEWAPVQQLLLNEENVICPTTASGCLFQSWNGVNGSIVWHFAMEAGSTLVKPFPLQGSLWVVSGVQPTDMQSLWARFAQMGDEVKTRDESETEFVLNRVWVGTSTPPNSDWTAMSESDFTVVNAGSCTVTANHTDGVRVRSAKLVDAEVVTVLAQGTTLSVMNVDDAGWITVTEGYIAPNAAVTLTGCESG